MKKFLFLIPAMAAMIAAGQNAQDALRYSQVFYGGTARYQGMGGAFGAIGADFSVIPVNPAGIGLYHKSEFSFSPSSWIGHSSTEYNGTKGSDSRYNFNFGNSGFVFAIPTHKKDQARGLKYFNFAIGFNRQNNFNNQVAIEGNNDANSLMTNYTDILNSQPYLSPERINDKYPFDIALAYNADLIFYDTIRNVYRCDAPNGGVYQRKAIKTTGSMNEFDFSLGANLSDKLFFGVSFGVPFLRYTESSRYEELKNSDSITYFRSLAYEQYLRTRGTGINFKAGIIYRPVYWVRVGAAIHTPTYYPAMHDYWYSTMYGNFDDGSTTAYSPDGYFDYRMTTPFRAIGSIAFFISDYGIISGEYEYVNYNQARFSSPDASFTDVNEEIIKNYRSPVNVRAGTEWRIYEFRLRGGFGYTASPYSDLGKTKERFTASGGIGYRGKYIFSDLSYVWSQTKQDYYLYDSYYVNPSHTTDTGHSITWTFGFRF